MKKTLRTFVAVEIDDAIRLRAVELIAALSATAANVKWVEPENLHLTLKFLGDVHQRDIADVCRSVEQGVSQLAPFELEVLGAGGFPSAARPRTLWLGTQAGRESMVTLHDRVEAPLAELGYREEHRRFQPHLTLGRVRGDGSDSLGKLVTEHAQFLAGRMTVSRVTIFSSRLTPAGAIHEVLGVARLG